VCLKAAIGYAPLYAEAYFNLGHMYVGLEDFVPAAQHFANALQVRPDWPEALNNLGVAFAGLEQWDQAVLVYRRALELRPYFADAMYNLGKTLKAQGRLREAAGAYEATLAQHPGHAQAANNLGIIWDQLGAFAAAQGYFKRAIELAPDFADAHYNLGTSLLAQGDFARGWTEFEWRFLSTQMRDFPRRVEAPVWRGEAGQGRVLLIHAEQGFGDSLQFCRFAPLAAARGWRVVLEVPGALVRLLGCLPGVTCVAAGAALPAFDAQVPMLSLPLAFGTTVDSIPAITPYLGVPAAEVARWGALLPEGRRVGLVWAGNPRAFSRVLAEVDQRRSIAPSLLAPLLEVPGWQFISLQKEGAALPVVDVMDQVTDFADTAALIMNLDLVISVDTAVAHLAAALGKPVWLLNRYDACWRWLRGREDSPWYPSLRLFNQAAPGDWDGVVAAVAGALRKEASTSFL
jgi:Flp pilus assembly protein TadD